MPDKDDQEALKRAHEDKREGKSPSTQAGEFVHEEIDHVREGKHGARSTKQAIAIGLSKARRAGVHLKAPKRGTASAATRKKASQDTRRSHRKSAPSRTRSRATSKALRREEHSAASRTALSRQAHSSARRRGHAARSRAAKKAARTRKRES
ncbi:MAG TPA: DUF6496 domain-containing protein [Thermoanaerobaculia bacterium]|jgi:hypothetical protein